MIRLQVEKGFTLIETMLVVAVIGVVSVMAVPMFTNLIANFRVTGDARGIANSAAVAKMRAASNFSRTRLYADLTGRMFYLQNWDKEANGGAGGWVTEGGATYLSTGVDFDFAPIAAPPPNTQGTIGQSPACKTDEGDDIDGTACIMFNSRGVPIDNTFAPTGGSALYITDGTEVYGVTVASTGMLRSWHARAISTGTWVLH